MIRILNDNTNMEFTMNCYYNNNYIIENIKINNEFINLSNFINTKVKEIKNAIQNEIEKKINSFDVSTITFKDFKNVYHYISDIKNSNLEKVINTSIDYYYDYRNIIEQNNFTIKINSPYVISLSNKNIDYLKSIEDITKDFKYNENFIKMNALFMKNKQIDKDIKYIFDIITFLEDKKSINLCLEDKISLVKTNDVYLSSIYRHLKYEQKINKVWKLCDFKYLKYQNKYFEIKKDIIIELYKEENEND